MFKEGINTIIIESYDELACIIKGKHEKNKMDLREDFIFRGLSNIEYELIPSALRRNKLNQLEINELIESDHIFKVSIDENDAKMFNLEYSESINDGEVIIGVDKYGNLIHDVKSDYKVLECDLQRERENYLLLKFFNYADKSGLKVKSEGFLRELIHNYSSKRLEEYWLDFDILETISLAQHYGLPTKALDWSYDYKVSLYFAVKDVIESNLSSDGVLWALNYKLIENHNFNEEYYVNLHIHRPEYNTNPNLNAQKGLFTFLERYVGDYDKPLNKIISDELNKTLDQMPWDNLYESKIRTIPDDISKNDTIFYKFIIPKEIKQNILNELYLEGYSEEYLFPGYKGVCESVINRVKLNEILKNNDEHIKKSILLSVDWNLNEIINKNQLYVFVNLDFKEEIDKIFIYHNNDVVGYFRGNEIIKDSLNVLWEQFGEHSGLSEDKFDECFKGNDESFAIRINDLNIFKHSIKLCDFELENDFCFVEDNEDLKFLLNFN